MVPDSMQPKYAADALLFIASISVSYKQINKLLTWFWYLQQTNICIFTACV